jgi:ribonucleoside-diphosphate reductase alpha chain
MRIVKRDKTSQGFMPNKILTRIKTQSVGLKVDSVALFQEVIPLISDNITTTEIDEIIAFKAADKIIQHPDYSLLGGRILLSRQSKLIGKELQPVDLTYDFFAATTFLQKYSMRDSNKTPIELPSCMYERVASYLHGNDEFEKAELLEELKSKRANFATPTYTNAGIEKRGGMISCNLTHLEDDSFEGIENTLTRISSASKEGSGIGLLIDPLRSKESIVESFQGNAGGVVRLADMVQSKMRFYKQGSRSGSCALYLSLWHKDIFDFLELTLPIGDEQMRTRDLFTSVVINDLFMKKLEAGEDWYLFCPNDLKKAGLKPLYNLWGKEFDAEYEKAVLLGLGKKVNPKEIFDSIIKSQVESGRPYVMFKDNANKRNMQRNIGPIKQSNLCITGDQRVITDKGYLTAKELYESGEKLNLFDGNKLVPASEMKIRAKNDDVYKITLENGIEHKVTSYHGIPVIDNRNNIRRVDCKDLKIGDKVDIQTKKGLFGARKLVTEAYLLGLYQSDGTQNNSSIMFDLWENDFDLVEVVEESVHELYDKYGYTPRYFNKGGYFVDNHNTQGGVKKKRLTSSFFKEFGFKKGSVPQWIWESDEETQWSYIKGLLQADGTVYLSQSKGQPIQLSYADINKNFLKELQLIFNNLGLQSSIHDLHSGGKRLLPDGKGGVKEYNCKDSFRLVIGSKNSVLEVEKNTGFLSRKNIILEDRKYRDNSKKSSKVLSIEYIGKEDVFCPTVYNDEHIFVTQGMKTFNCIEIMEASKPSYTPQCTLASINLSEHDNLETIAKSTRVLVRALNRVIDVNKWSDDWSENAGVDQRALAIGVAGMADFFAKKKVSFESEEAKKWNNDIFETMYKSAVIESMKIAEENGKNYPAWDSSPYSIGETYIEGWSPKPNGEPIPMANSLLLGLMPTASSAILLGVFESFEPVTSNLFTRRVGQGEFLVINKYLVNELIENNLWDSEMIDKVIRNKGSVQNIIEIPEEIRSRYKEVWEIPQKALLDLAIIRNKYVDQSQSLNVYHADAKYGKIASALMYAWKGGLKTGVYYTRTKSKLDTNTKLASSQITTSSETKPKDSQFECFGCSA